MRLPSSTSLLFQYISFDVLSWIGSQCSRCENMLKELWNEIQTIKEKYMSPRANQKLSINLERFGYVAGWYVFIGVILTSLRRRSANTNRIPFVRFVADSWSNVTLAMKFRWLPLDTVLLFFLPLRCFLVIQTTHAYLRPCKTVHKHDSPESVLVQNFVNQLLQAASIGLDMMKFTKRSMKQNKSFCY